MRVTRAATLFPSQMAVGATFSTAAAAAVAGQTARELRGLGFNLNFGPVVDVNSNPANPVIGVRSYGSDPALVGRLATSAIQASQAAGVLAVAKHFPGHGDAGVDSHRELPLIDQPLARLEAVEFPPFRAAIRAGVDGVMTAHVLLPALELDPKRSATLSAPVLRYLRETLGYQGLIITDDLEMGAIVNDYGTAEAAKLAFQAGADVLLFRRNVAEQRRAHALLVAAVKSGEITQERLDASARRVLETKLRRGLIDLPPGTPAASGTPATPAPGAPAPSAVRTPVPTSRPGTSVTVPATLASPSARTTAQASLITPQVKPASASAASGPASDLLSTGAGIALEVARKSVTLVKNDSDALPFRLPAAAPVCVVFPQPEAIGGVEIAAVGPSEGPAGDPATLGDAVRSVYPRARAVAIGLRPPAAESAAATACVREARAAVIGSYNLFEYPQQATLLRSLAALAGPTRSVAMVALRLPYDLAQLDAAPALLAIYSNRPASLRAAADVLFGRAPAPTGHLPVPVASRWGLGHGLLEWSRPDTQRELS